MRADLRIPGRLGLLLLLTGTAPVPGGKLDAGAESPVVAITASDFAFVAPDSVRAGLVALHLRNEGLMPHHAWLVRLDAPRTLRELERELVERGTLPKWALDAGGPGVVDPGGEARVSIVLAPGRHVILSGERLPDGSTAVMRGMYHVIEVVGQPGDVSLPSVDVTVDIGDRGMRIGGSLPAGRQRVLVRNRSESSGELRIYRLRPGQSERTLLAWLARESSIAPAQAVGGVVGLAPAAWAVLELALARGEYVLVHRPPLMRGAAAPPRARTVSVH